MDIEYKRNKLREYCRKTDDKFCNTIECKLNVGNCLFGQYSNDEVSELYELIKDEIIIPQPNSLEEIIESMAYEIAKHRYPNKYEYDDELIEKIIEEFS